MGDKCERERENDSTEINASGQESTVCYGGEIGRTVLPN